MVIGPAIAVASASLALAVPPGFVVDSIGGQFNCVVGAVGLDDGRVLAWERTGQVWMVNSNGQRVTQPVLNIADEVQGGGDQGLLGLALDPDFPAKPFIYLLYVVDRHHLLYFGTPQYNPNANLYYKATIGRVTRYELDRTTSFTSTVPGSRLVLLGTSAPDGIPILHSSHSVGSLVFGTDGSLLVTTGDNASYSVIDSGGATSNPNVTSGLADGIIRPAEDVGAFRSQMIDSLCGKVLRIDPATGDGIASNPWFVEGFPRRPRSRVWTVGLRNPYRASIVPGSGSHEIADAEPGTLVIGDVGLGLAEEINFVSAPGGNLGWPLFEGQARQPSYAKVSVTNADEVDPASGPVDFRDLVVHDSQIPHEHINSSRVFQGESTTTRAPDAEVRNAYVGFTGTGYVSLPPSSWVEQAVAVAPTGTIAIRYTNAVSSSVVAVSIGGQPPVTVTLPPTGSLDEWRIVRATLPAARSGPTTIRLTRAFGGALYMDSFWIEPTGSAPTLDPRYVALHRHARPALDWRVARATTPGFNALGAATGIPLGSPGGASGSAFSGSCAIGGPDMTGGTWPPQFQGVYFGDYVTGWIQFAKIDWTPRCGKDRSQCTCGRVTDVLAFEPSSPKLVGLFADRARSTMYAAVWNGLQRIRWMPGGSEPPVIAVSQSHLYGASPLTVTFDASATIDPEGQPVTFDWEFGDGQPAASGPVVTRTFAGSGGAPTSVTVTLRATDAGGAQSVRQLAVGIDNTPPTVTISSLLEGQLYPTSADTEFPLRASVSDAEHDPAAIQCQWQVTLFHDTHNHPEPPIDTCTATQVLQATHCSDDDVFWYEVTVTATDPTGLSASDTVTLQPDCLGWLECPGDIDGSGVIDGMDLAGVLSYWGAPGNTDTNLDGTTDGFDLATVLSYWGRCAGK